VVVVAINEATAEVKYFITNATGEPLYRLLGVAFGSGGRDRLESEDWT
jgi:hypothetical protein